MLAATLRPETMYGQTNCWILPHDKEGNEVYYGAYKTRVPNEVSAHLASDCTSQRYRACGPDPNFAVMVFMTLFLAGCHRR